MLIFQRSVHVFHFPELEIAALQLFAQSLDAGFRFIELRLKFSFVRCLHVRLFIRNEQLLSSAAAILSSVAVGEQSR